MWFVALRYLLSGQRASSIARDSSRAAHHTIVHTAFQLSTMVWLYERRPDLALDILGRWAVTWLGEPIYRAIARAMAICPRYNRASALLSAQGARALQKECPIAAPALPI